MDYLINDNKTVRSSRKVEIHCNMRDLYNFCIEKGYNYNLINTCLELGIKPNKKILDEFDSYEIDKMLGRLEALQISLRAKRYFKNNRFYKD